MREQRLVSHHGRIALVTPIEPGNALGSMVASQYPGATSVEQSSSILYLAAILLVISLVTNVVAQVIVVRFERARRAV